MKWFRRLESWCIPNELKEKSDVYRNASFLVSSILVMLFTLVFFAYTHWAIEYYIGFYVALLFILFLSAFLFILRITSNLVLVANLTAFITIVGISILVITSGGIRSSATIYYLLASLAVVWIIKKRWVIFWSGLALASALGIMLYEAAGNRMVPYFPGQNVYIFATVNYVGFLLHLIRVLINYRITQDAALGDMNEINNSLVEKQEALRLANEELREQHLNVQSAYSALKYTSDKINEQKEEILIKSRELQAANHKISQINASLNKIVEKRTQQLRRTNEELDQFLYRSSHDLRRPLTTILGLKHVAELTFTDRAILELFEKVTDTAHNMDKMLAKLITVSDISKTSLRASHINFEELTNRVRTRFQRQQDTYGVSIDLKLGPEVDFRAPERLVEIVVEQLVENSFNFISLNHGENPYIRIEVDTHNSRGVVRVIDNGIGIDPSVKEKIFEMYFKGTERSQGNGLGLYVAQKAAQKMMGTIELSENSPQGTTIFELVVPMAVVV